MDPSPNWVSHHYKHYSIRWGYEYYMDPSPNWVSHHYKHYSIRWGYEYYLDPSANFMMPGPVHSPFWNDPQNSDLSGKNICPCPCLCPVLFHSPLYSLPSGYRYAPVVIITGSKTKCIFKHNFTLKNRRATRILFLMKVSQIQQDIPCARQLSIILCNIIQLSWKIDIL